MFPSTPQFQSENGSNRKKFGLFLGGGVATHWVVCRMPANCKKNYHGKIKEAGGGKSQ